jgi:actin-like ATPase involved in cell morphogenesis
MATGEQHSDAARPASVSSATVDRGAATAKMAGKGLDIGTANILAAVRDQKGGIVVRCERNAFLDIQGDVHSRSMLTRLNVPYVVHENSLLVIGGAAFDLANVFGRPTRRPMRDGLISPSEKDALPMIQLIIKKVLGDPASPNEPCFFSVPAESVDRDNNIVYHQGLFQGILQKLGYNPTPMNEGHAVTFAELAADDFTGIGISFGGGMVNVCVAYKTIPALTFSVARGGDWIDQNAANVLGMPSSKVTFIKESGMDIRTPKGREQEAIAIYYRNLMGYTINHIRNRLMTGKDLPSFTDPVDIVCAGGGALILGFAEVFKEEVAKVKFPLQLKNIRLAKEPLNSISQGCLVAAVSSME